MNQKSNVVPMAARAAHAAEQTFIDGVLVMWLGDPDALEEERPGRDSLWAFTELEEYVKLECDAATVALMAGVDLHGPLSSLEKILATRREIVAALAALLCGFPGVKIDDGYMTLVIDNLPNRLPQLVLRLAMKDLIRRRFLPSVGEILDAIENADRRVKAVLRGLRSP